MKNNFSPTCQQRFRLCTAWTVLLLVSITACLSGCASGLMNLTGANAIGTKFADLVGKEDKKRIEKEEDNDFETRVDTPLLDSYISVTGNNLVVLRGVGFVTGLDGTGDDPPPSHLRKELLDEMTRRNIPNPGSLLASRNTTLVIVTAYLPAMVRDGQPFDVRVALPPNSEATSLKGGWLLETRLSEEMNISGRGNVKGHHYATAHGAILTALGDGGVKGNAAMLRRGSIPGGAISNTERNLEIILRNEFRGQKTSKQVENSISGRLHHYNSSGQRVSMAEAKTDLMIDLKIHPTYRNNFPRYQKMLRSIAFRESDIARRMRIERLAKEIMIPEKAESSAIQLEAIGNEGIPFLKAGLKSPDLEVRFHVAQALAYLEDSSGVEVLKQAALEEPAFRVYALAALSVISDADGIVALRDLLSDKTLETRYGAVRALKENSPHDPFLGTVEFPNQFVLHAIETTGPPAVHVVRYRAPEVVVFGTNQELRLPVVLNVGNRIRVIGQGGDNKVVVTKYNIGAEPQRHTASTNLVEILHVVAGLGASYPDVVQMLLEAETQHNLYGELGIDRLPQAGRVFSRNFGVSSESETKPAKLGTPSLTPGLFDRLEDDEVDTTEEDTSALARMFSAKDDDSKSATDKSKSKNDAKDEKDADKASHAASKSKDESDDESSIEQMNLSEGGEPGEADSSNGPEQADFKEPMGAKMRRIMLGPFQN